MRVHAIIISLLFTILPTFVAGVTLDVSGLPASQGSQLTLRWSGVPPFTLFTFLATADNPSDFQFNSETDAGENTGATLTVGAPAGVTIRFLVQDETQKFALSDVDVIDSNAQPLASISSVSVQSIISIVSTVSLASVASTQAAASLTATTSFAPATTSFASSSIAQITSTPPTSVIATSSQVPSSATAFVSRTSSTSTSAAASTNTGLSQNDTAEEKRLNTAAIIGGLIGGLIVAGVIILLLIRCCKRRRNQDSPETQGRSILGLTGLSRPRTSSESSSQLANQGLAEKGSNFPSNLQLPEVPRGSRTTWGSRLSARFANLGRRTSLTGSNRNSGEVMNWNPDRPHLTPITGSVDTLGSPFRGGTGPGQAQAGRPSSISQRLSGFVPPIYLQFTSRSAANGSNQDAQRSQGSVARSSRSFDLKTPYAEDAFYERPAVPPKESVPPLRPPRPAKSIDFGATVLGVNGRVVQTTIPAPLAPDQNDTSSSRLVGFGRHKRQNSGPPPGQVDVKNISKPMPLQPEPRQLAPPPPRQVAPPPPRQVTSPTQRQSSQDPFSQPGLSSWFQRNDSRYPTIAPQQPSGSNPTDRALSPTSNSASSGAQYGNPFASPSLSTTRSIRSDDSGAYEHFGPKPTRRPAANEPPRPPSPESPQYADDFRPTSLSVIEEIATPSTTPVSSRVQLQSRPPPLTTTGSSSSSNTATSQVTRTTQATTTESSIKFPSARTSYEDPIPAALPDSFNSTSNFLNIDPSLPPLPTDKRLVRKKSSRSDVPSSTLTRDSSFNTTYSHESGRSNTVIRKELLQGVRTALSQKSTSQDLPISPVSVESIDPDPYSNYYPPASKSNRPLPSPPAAQAPPESSDRRALESWGMSPSIYYGSGATGRNYRLSAATARTSTTGKHISSQSGRYYSGFGSGEEEWKELERQLKWADGEAHVLPNSRTSSPPRRLSVMNP